MAFTQFEASTPVVKPAVEEVVYDKYWLKRMVVNAENSIKPIGLRATFVPARDVSYESNVDGVVTTIEYKETMPNGPEKTLVINDVFEKASQDLEFAVTMDNVFKVLKKIATENNIL